MIFLSKNILAKTVQETLKHFYLKERKNSYISPRNTFLTFKQKVKHTIYFFKVFKVLTSEIIYKHTLFSANKIFLQVLW